MIQSGGVLVKTADTVLWSGGLDRWTGWPGSTGRLLDSWSYGTMYTRQLWVNVLVAKRAKAVARLPLKTYQRLDDGSRQDATLSPYGQLLAHPSKSLDPFSFWLWVVSTFDTYGNAFLLKIRDAGGRPVELMPIHPANMHAEETTTPNGRSTKVRWWYDNGLVRIDDIPRRDIVHVKSWNPDTTLWGLSPLEPLRATLEAEEGARRATAALWRNGARPGLVLQHPKTLSAGAHERLAATWKDVQGGVDNWARTAVLEEGVEAKMIPLNLEELQYIEARRLNREEVCAAYDMPPPAVHILDRATFSNITAQFRSVYRDTIAPLLRLLESTLEHELRDGRMGADGEPDFGDAFYGEFLLDEVLRGDFEARVVSYQAGVNSGWLMPSEVRELENLPFVEGSDVLLVNSTLVPIEVAAAPAPDPSAAPALMPATPDSGAAPATLPVRTIRTVMGRLGRATSMADVDFDRLSEGLNGDTDAVLELFMQSDTIADFKASLRACAAKE